MSEQLEEQLETVDEDRRSAIRKIVLGAAYVAPVVASFAMQGRSTVALAQSGNGS
jgi:hypothetical protein